ncbi:hypothetical protein TNIN_234931 [Trichonephila inaurata madagascariensis]|uniref:Fanconi-associated nuclease n=1 Tax=Trichonephila inaurata madagascariensis TaxID=2747483 RepID=A0A8X6MBY9_9ARAC|nr:hypothetical protein TNIN_234931 [Trichonephila inaurata madagascariensis]
MGPKKHGVSRTVLTINTKREMIAQVESGQKMADVARQYGLNRSTVCTILPKKDIIKKTQAAEGVTKITSAKQRNAIHDKTERILLVWINEREMKRDITIKPIIQEKAREIFEKLKEQTPGSSSEELEFKATTGWFTKFKRRSVIKHVLMHGESASADKEAIEKYCLKFQEFIETEGYRPQQIFNCDETGLFWKRILNHTYITKDEKSVPGHKHMKDRLTLLLGASASGDMKLKPLLVYHSENPRALKKNSIIKSKLPVMWRSNQRAWVYCQDYKGRWYDRLALNLEQHLKQPEKALKAIKSGLKDTNVRVGPRYSLLTRALRITKSFDESDEFRQQILKDAAVNEAPKVIIKGRLCPRPVIGRRHVFISSSSTADIDEVTVLGVEQLSIEHYRENGFPQGIHGEGSTFISIYALLFWDIIYDGNIPDVFISPYQTHPLDLNSESFFLNRKDQILNHLKTLKQSTNEALREIVKTTWENHHGQASLVSWDHFTDLEHVQGLICCFGSDILSGICERLAKDFRFTRSGVPDLVVWNPETLHVKIVEVKGPGDKLSSKQILWLDYLIQLGADAEVCLVEAVGSKKLRKETF